jgi:F0F1-type ATP synthase assembly protein I
VTDPDPQSPAKPTGAPVPTGVGRDPRLDIPEILRTPVKRPASMQTVSGSTSGKPASITSSLMEVSRSLAIGIDFLCIIAAGGAFGWAIDHLAKTGGRWGLVTGAVIGFIYGTYRLIKRLSGPSGPAPTSPKRRDQR